MHTGNGEIVVGGSALLLPSAKFDDLPRGNGLRVMLIIEDVEGVVSGCR